MKRKNGFTLIELLAIIVILAIIAVITVPIILNIIETSKKGAAQDSAYGYKDAVNKWYVSKLQEDNKYTLNGGYTISEGKLNDIEIPLSGDKPTSGNLHYTNSILDGGCLTIGEYKVTFDKNGRASSAEKGECPSPFGYVFYGTNNKLETTKPTVKTAYLRYELTNGEVANGTVPEGCIYTETYGGELCLKINEFDVSAKKIKTYFGYDENTWIKKSEDTWENSAENPTIRCSISSTHIYCDDSTVYANADSNGNLRVHSYSNFACSVYSAGFSGCL